MFHAINGHGTVAILVDYLVLYDACTSVYHYCTHFDGNDESDALPQPAPDPPGPSGHLYHPTYIAPSGDLGATRR